MPTFEYVDKQGNLQTITASSADEAINKAPNRMSDSGVAEVTGSASSSPTPSNNSPAKKPRSSSSGGLPPLPSTEDSVKRINNFSGALNVAIDEARQQRADKTLDMVGDIVPTGALPATSFSSIVDSFNSDSRPLEASLAGKAIDYTAQQEQNRFELAVEERDRVIAQKEQIQELATSAINAGASQEMVNTILSFSESGDIDAAISAAAAGLQTKNKDTIEKVGSNLVSIDDEGNVTLLFSGGSSGGGGGNGFFKSGGLSVSNSDIGQLSRELEQSRGSDGHANTQLYTDAYNQWVSEGGLPQDFLKELDPDFYLNPNDSSIPGQIRSQMKQTSGSSNPF